MTRHFSLIVLLFLFLSVVFAQNGVKPRQDVLLRLVPGELVNGVPDSFNFVFVNVSEHELRMPPVTVCGPGRYSGKVELRYQFSPVRSRTGGGGGWGCGSGSSHTPGILEQAEAWNVLKPGQSLSFSFKRKLWADEEAAGNYEFWGEYEPPPLTEKDVQALREAGIEVPRNALESARLTFTRPE